MKRLTLLFSLYVLLALLAAPAHANDNRIRQFTVWDPYYVDANNQPLDDGACASGIVLNHVRVSFRPPNNRPDQYYLRWTARPNGRWRSFDKDASALAHSRKISASAWSTHDLPNAHLGTSIGYRNDGGWDAFYNHMKLPAGQAMKIMMRPVWLNDDGTVKRAGPKKRVTINTAAWIQQHTDLYPHSDGTQYCRP